MNKRSRGGMAFFNRIFSKKSKQVVRDHTISSNSKSKTQVDISSTHGYKDGLKLLNHGAQSMSLTSEDHEDEDNLCGEEEEYVPAAICLEDFVM